MAKAATRPGDGSDKKRSGSKHSAKSGNAPPPMTPPHQQDGAGIGQGKAGAVAPSAGTKQQPTIKGAVRKRVVASYVRGKK